MGASGIMGPSTTTRDTSNPMGSSNRPRSTTIPDTNTIPNSASDDGGASDAPSDTTDDVRLDDGSKGNSYGIDDSGQAVPLGEDQLPSRG